MNSQFQFDPNAHQLTGPAGTLPIADSDPLASRFLMLVEGECLDENIGLIAQKYGFCRQRYYQLLHAYQAGGVPALQPRPTGPKSNYRRTEPAVRQVLRYLFLDPQMSAEVITQKLCQTHFQISLRSVQRIIADYGLQKKTLPPQPPQPRPRPRPAGPTGRKAHSRRVGRRPQRGTGGSPAPGR